MISWATRSGTWVAPTNAVSLLVVALGIWVWRKGATLLGVLFWVGASSNLIYEAVVVARGWRDDRGGEAKDSAVGGSSGIVRRARWSVVRNGYLSALPLLLLASARRFDVAGTDVLGNGLMVAAIVLLAVPGRVLRQWVEETDRRDDYFMAGPFMSEFSSYSLRLAGWDWPWFNRVRISVAVVGLVGWAVALSGSVLSGWR